MFPLLLIVLSFIKLSPLSSAKLDSFKHLKVLLDSIRSPVTVLLSSKDGGKKMEKEKNASIQPISITKKPSLILPYRLKLIKPSDSLVSESFLGPRLDESECKGENFEIIKKSFPIEKILMIKHKKSKKYYKTSNPGDKSYDLSLFNPELYKKLDSPFISRFHCLVTISEQQLQIFDDIQGMDLETFIEEENVISEHDLRIYASELILALKYLEKNGISLLNLFPQDITIDKYGHLKIAKLYPQSSEKGPISNFSDYSSYYDAPERINSFSDPSQKFYPRPLHWYALGLILHEIFYQQSPKTNDDYLDMRRRHKWKEALDILTSEKSWPFLNFYSLVKNEQERLLNENNGKILSKEATDLIKGLLNADLNQRMNFADKELLNHPWFISPSLNDKSENWWNEIANKNISPINRPIFREIDWREHSFNIEDYPKNARNSKYSLELLAKLRKSKVFTSKNQKDNQDANSPIILPMATDQDLSICNDISNLFWYESFYRNSFIIDRANDVTKRHHFIVTSTRSKSYFGRDGKILENKFNRLENEIRTANEISALFPMEEADHSLAHIATPLCILPFNDRLIRIFKSNFNKSKLVNSLDAQYRNSIEELNVIEHVESLISYIQRFHEKGISWGGLSVENINIVPEYLPLIGFENAQRFNPNASSTSTSDFIFDTHYMAPEMIKVAMGESSNYEIEPIDWYSLGCVIYKLVFGRDPYDLTIDIDAFDKKKWKDALKVIQEIPYCLGCNNDKKCREVCSDTFISFNSNFKSKFILDAIDLIKKLMNHDPKERMKFVKEKLKDHPWFKSQSSNKESKKRFVNVNSKFLKKLPKT